MPTPPLPAVPDASQRPFSLTDGVRPVVILGAARSGTKFLRALLGASRACAVVPYGLNHVWRYEHATSSDDVLHADQASDRATRYIRRTLLRTGRHSATSSARYLVERTCANTLRVGYVRRVLPDARFIHIVRDGRDVTASARHQWERSPDRLVRLKKLWAAPRAALCAGLRHVRTAVRSGLAARARSTTWGPRYPGIASDLKVHPVLGVCARQWMHCVEACLDGLAAVPSPRRLTVRYETLVASPDPLDKLASFLDLPDPEAVHAQYRRTVYSDSVGAWKTALPAADQAAIDSLLAPTLRRLGYAPAFAP